jgi:hypothetical protein
MKRRNFRESFCENKMFDFAKTQGKKITQQQILFICITKNIGKELGQREKDVVLQHI